MVSLGQKISTLRNKRGLSQAQLAEKLGIGTSTLGMYETNKREPAYQTLVAIADFFGVSVDELLGRKVNFSLSEPNDQMNSNNKPNATDLTNPILAFDGRPIVGDQAQKIRDFAKFLLQEEDKHKNGDGE